MPTRCTSRRSSSSTRRSGRASPTGPTSWRRTIDQATRMLGVVRYPYMPTDVDRVMQQVAVEIGQRGDVQQGAGRRLLREPGRRGRRSVLRRRRAAAHRLHLMRQVQHRLRPQRQEQADDELPLPGGEARRRGPRAARGVRPRPARRGRVRGAHASSRLGAASRASAPSHLHRRAGDRRRPRVRLGEAASSHAAQGPPDRASRASSASGRERTPSSCSRSRGRTASGSATRRRSASRRDRSRSPPASGRIDETSIEPVYWGVGNDLFAFLVTYHQHGEQKHPTAAWIKELVEAPDRSARLRRPAPLVRADGDHALLADDRHLDRAVLARRPAAKPAQLRHASLGAHPDHRGLRRPNGREDGRPRGGAAVRGHQPHRLGPLHRRDPDRRQQRERRRRPLPAPVRSAGPSRHGRERDAGQHRE